MNLTTIDLESQRTESINDVILIAEGLKVQINVVDAQKILDKFNAEHPHGHTDLEFKNYVTNWVTPENFGAKTLEEKQRERDEIVKKLRKAG